MDYILFACVINNISHNIILWNWLKFTLDLNQGLIPDIPIIFQNINTYMNKHKRNEQFFLVLWKFGTPKINYAPEHIGKEFETIDKITLSVQLYMANSSNLQAKYKYW